MRRVRDSKRLRLKLERQAFGYFKVAEQAHVQIQETRPANKIAPGISQDARRRHLRDSARIKVFAGHVESSTTACRS